MSTLKNDSLITKCLKHTEKSDTRYLTDFVAFTSGVSREKRKRRPLLPLLSLPGVGSFAVLGAVRPGIGLVALRASRGDGREHVFSQLWFLSKTPSG